MARLIMPLRFRKQGQVVEIRKIADLREFFQPEYLPKLRAYLRDGSLSRFFYGLRRDELKNLLEAGRKEGADDLTLLNRLAAALEIPTAPFNQTDTELEPEALDPEAPEQTLALLEQPLADLLNKVGEVSLPPGTWESREEITLAGPLILTGAGPGETVLELTRLTVSGGLTLRHLTLKGAGASGVLLVAGGRLSAEGVVFAGMTVQLEERAAADLTHCRFQGTPVALELSPGAVLTLGPGKWEEVAEKLRLAGVDLTPWVGDIPRGQLRCSLDQDTWEMVLAGEGDLQLVLAYPTTLETDLAGPLRLRDAELEINNLHLKAAADAWLAAERVRWTASNFRLTGGRGLRLQEAELRLTQSYITGSQEAGLAAKASAIWLQQVQIRDNAGPGLSLHDGSRLHLEKGELSRNGNSNEPQLFLANSSAELLATKIAEGKGRGIEIVSSKVRLKDVKIKNHPGCGLTVKENSKLQINTSEITRNDESQVLIKNSEAELLASTVAEGKARGIEIEASVVNFKDVKVTKHQALGLSVVKNSKLHLSNGVITENGKIQVFIADSEAELLATTVADGKARGIEIEASVVNLYDVKVTDHQDFGVVAVNKSKLHLSNSVITGNGDIQIVINDSEAELLAAKIRYGNGIGIKISSSKVILNDIIVAGLQQAGLCVEDGSELLINNGEISKNGDPQVFVENSKAELMNATVSEGQGCGIMIASSPSAFGNIKVFGNRGNGLIVIKTDRLFITDSLIYHNGDSTKFFPQLFIQDSKVKIGRTKVYDAINGNGIHFLSGNLTLNSVTTWGNKKGLVCKSESFKEENCDFKDGKDTPCFITTAVLVALGKGDNCEELQDFRCFRDGWLRAQPEGEALIAEYYHLGPRLVAALAQMPGREAWYRRLWQDYLQPALVAIRRNDNLEACRQYVTMVTYLRHTLLRG